MAADCIVIGAGFAGLGAAKRLKELGVTARVLEASSRAGGRARTCRATESNAPVELGATWAHGLKGNELYDLAALRGLTTSAPMSERAPRTRRSVWLLRGGGEADEKEVESALALHSNATDNAEHADAADVNSSLADYVARAVSSSTIAMSPTKEAVLQWRECLQSAIDGPDSNADLGVQSLRLYDELDGQNVRLGSFEHVALSLASQDAHEVVYNAPVTELHLSEDETRVRCILSDGRCLEASAVIVALPLAVLQNFKILFAPSLPAKTTESLQSVKLGAVEKVFFVLPESEHNESLPTGINLLRMKNDRCTDSEEVWWPSRMFSLWREQENVLLAWLTGADECRQMASRSEIQLIDDLMHEMSKYDIELPRPYKVVRSTWTHDSLFGGSYSYLPPGVSADAVETLQQSHWGGRLQFAGEHCSVARIGTADGAYVTGKLAAERAVCHG